VTHALDRAAVVAAARTWLGTPWHHDAAVKGGGIDCAHLLLEAFAEAGAIARFAPDRYPADWHLHKGEERFADTVARFAVEIAAAPPFKPATVLLFRHGRTFSHGAIVTAWPRIIHAYAAAFVVEEVDITGTPMLLERDGSPRPMRAFDRWGG
jgi:NlpC/P60 family putative phage cell wall peptidase